MRVEADFHVGSGPRTEQTMKRGRAAKKARGRVPRVPKLMALAIRFEGLLASGVVSDQAELARLGHVSRGRISQIMNLLCLAPDIQEAILCLDRVRHGRDPVCEAQLRPIARDVDWDGQRVRWKLASREITRSDAE